MAHPAKVAPNLEGSHCERGSPTLLRLIAVGWVLGDCHLWHKSNFNTNVCGNTEALHMDMICQNNITTNCLQSQTWYNGLMHHLPSPCCTTAPIASAAM